MATTVESYARGALITAVLEDKLDWHPTQDQTFLAKMRRALNRRLIRMATDASALFQKMHRVFWQPDVTTGIVDVSSTDPYVWRVAKSTGATWATDGTWEGRYIEVTAPTTGQLYTYRIAELWDDASYYYLSTFAPHPNGTDTGCTYRIYSPGIWLPAEVSQVQSIIPWSERWGPIPIGTPMDVENASMYDWKGTYAGSIPAVAYRGERDQLFAPQRTPTAELVNGTWAGPEPSGTFKFLYTYILGKDDDENSIGPPTSYRPLLESSPSTESSEVTGENGAGTNLIRITVPEIEWITNFGVSGTGRSGHGGIRKRIYVARSAIATSGASHPIIEAGEVYYHLVDLAGDVTTYDWNGSISPNKFLPHRTSNGRQTLCLQPRPETRLEFRLRCITRPQPLLHDQDTCELPPELCDVLLDALAAEAWGLLGNPQEQEKAEKRYQNGLERLMKQTERQGPAQQIIRRPQQPGNYLAAIPRVTPST